MGHTITTPTTRTTLVTKPLRQPLEQRPRMSDWLATTQMLFNQVAAFYFAVLDAHPPRARSPCW
jgi:hypothetical protein